MEMCWRVRFLFPLSLVYDMTADNEQIFWIHDGGGYVYPLACEY